MSWLTSMDWMNRVKIRYGNSDCEWGESMNKKRKFVIAGMIVVILIGVGIVLWLYKREPLIDIVDVDKSAKVYVQHGRQEAYLLSDEETKEFWGLLSAIDVYGETEPDIGTYIQPWTQFVITGTGGSKTIIQPDCPYVLYGVSLYRAERKSTEKLQDFMRELAAEHILHEDVEDVLWEL